MTDIRKQLADVKTARERLQELSKQFGEQDDVLSQQEDDLRIQVIREEKLLAAKPWAYVPTHEPSEHGSTFSLQAMGNWKDFRPLCDLLKPDFHSSYHLAYVTQPNPTRDGTWRHGVVELYFSDGDLMLVFDNDLCAIACIADFGLMVNTMDLESQRDGITAQLAGLNKLLERVKGWQPNATEGEST